jgi:molybdopterin converting factor small subunit
MGNRVTFIFNGLMLRFTDFTKEVEIAATNFEAALKDLLDRFPRLVPVLLDGTGRVRRTHQMFRNGEKVESGCYGDEKARSEVEMRSGDEIYVLTAVAGG